MVDAMDTLEALERSRAEFERRLVLIQADDWVRPTPCDEWDVRALVNHVIGGCCRYTALLRGGSADDFTATLEHDFIRSNATASFADAAAEMNAAFSAPGAFDRTVHHPVADMPGRVLAAWRCGDSTVHGWDLAHAIGADETLDAELVEWLWKPLSAQGPALSASGMFKHSDAVVPDDASLQSRLLQLLGR
ncbi:MAG: hypothetical protein NVS3B21_11710 [Acidimicrobiales bacterium]